MLYNIFSPIGLGLDDRLTFVETNRSTGKTAVRHRRKSLKRIIREVKNNAFTIMVEILTAYTHVIYAGNYLYIKAERENKKVSEKNVMHVECDERTY